MGEGSFLISRSSDLVQPKGPRCRRLLGVGFGEGGGGFVGFFLGFLREIEERFFEG